MSKQTRPPRRSRYTAPSKRHTPNHVGVGRCREDGCEKMAYHDRAEAKGVIRRVYPGDTRMRAYKCGSYWHIGHIPVLVLTGQLGIEEYLNAFDK